MTSSLATAVLALVPDNKVGDVETQKTKSAPYTEALAELLKDFSTRGLPNDDEVKKAAEGRKKSHVAVGDASELIHMQVKQCNTERTNKLAQRYGLTDAFLGAGVSGMALRTTVSGQRRALKLYQTNELQTFFVALREQEVAHYVSSVLFADQKASVTRPAVDVFDWWRVVASLQKLLTIINTKEDVQNNVLMSYRTSGAAKTDAERQAAIANAAPAAGGAKNPPRRGRAKPALVTVVKNPQVVPVAGATLVGTKWLPDDEATNTPIELTNLALTTRKPIEWFGIEMEYVELDFEAWLTSDKFNDKQFQTIFVCTVCLLMQLEEAGVRHGDCHAGNVRLRPVTANQTLTYTIRGQKYSFSSEYAPTLADWGRAYVKKLAGGAATTDDLEEEVLLLDAGSAQATETNVIKADTAAVRLAAANIKGVSAKHDAYRLAFSVVKVLATNNWDPSKKTVADLISLEPLTVTSVEMLQHFLNINTSAPIGPDNKPLDVKKYGNMPTLSVLKNVTYGQLFIDDPERDPGAWYVPWPDSVYLVDLNLRVRARETKK